MDEGTRVRVVREVERFPHFVVPEGRTGTVTQVDDDEARIRLDEQLEGAEEWDNQVQWFGEHRKEFEEDVTVIES